MDSGAGGNMEEGMSAKGLKTKLIVNYLPQTMTDMEFKNMFESIGPLDSYRVMRDRATSYSFGYGFVDYNTVEDAEAAMEKLNGYRMGHKTLRVAYSKPVGSSKNTNLHVTGLGTHVDEKALEELFAPHGKIVQVKILRGADGSSKGAGFVLFQDRDEADASIRSLQGYADGYGMNLQIHYAKDNSEQQRLHPKYQEFINNKFVEQQQQYSAANSGGYDNYNNHTAANANYNNYGGGYGMMDYNMQNGQRGAGRGRDNSPRYNPIARPMPGGGMGGGMGGMGGGMGGMQNTQTIVLYCYNIGPEATEGDLYALFSRFGRIVKVNVINGKGYGFVHMPIPCEANDAVRNLNGMLYKDKTLQVSVKTNNKTA